MAIVDSSGLMVVRLTWNGRQTKVAKNINITFKIFKDPTSKLYGTTNALSSDFKILFIMYLRS